MEHKSNKATVTNEFFSYYMELIRKEVLPYQWNALNDNIPGVEKTAASTISRWPNELKRGSLEGVWLYTWTKVERLTWDEKRMEAILKPLRDQTLTLCLCRPTRSFRVNGRKIPLEGNRTTLPVKAGETLALEAEW